MYDTVQLYKIRTYNYYITVSLSMDQTFLSIDYTQSLQMLGNILDFRYFWFNLIHEMDIKKQVYISAAYITIGET